MASGFSLIHHTVRSYKHRQSTQLCIVQKEKRKILAGILIKMCLNLGYLNWSFRFSNVIFLLDYIKGVASENNINFKILAMFRKIKNTLFHSIKTLT